MTKETKSQTEETVGKLLEEEASQKAPEAQVKEPEVTKEGAVEEAPKPVVFSEEELQRRISSAVAGHKGTVTKLQTDLKKVREESEQFRAQAEERSYESLLRTVQEQGGDVDAAKKLVERERTTNKREREMAIREAQLEELAATLSEAGRTKAAQDFMTAYNLDATNVEELLKSEDMKDMENKALRLALNKSKVEAKPPEKPSKGQGTTKGRDLSKMSDIEKLGLAAEGLI